MPLATNNSLVVLAGLNFDAGAIAVYKPYASLLKRRRWGSSEKPPSGLMTPTMHSLVW